MVRINGLDGDQLSKLLTPFVDRATCLECCKFYIAPETAACGHTYCRTCWKRRRVCPACAAPVVRNSLKLNLEIQKNTDHAQLLNDIFDKNFKFKLDEFDIDCLLDGVMQPEHANNVKDWLASSQNQFSAQVINSESTQDSIQDIHVKQTSTVQIHKNTTNVTCPKAVIHKHQPQDDWEKIEPMPEENPTKNCIIDDLPEIELSKDYEYTTDNPRRSSRKRELKNYESASKSHNSVTDQHSSKTLNVETEKEPSKTNQKWGNVKRMRQEFSKLNKKHRNKLNVSIEMFKKTQGTKCKYKSDEMDNNFGQLGYVIEDNTPDETPEKEFDADIIKKQINVPKSTDNVHCTINNTVSDCSLKSKISCPLKSATEKPIINNDDVQVTKENKNTATEVQSNIKANNVSRDSIKMPFIKKSALCTEKKGDNIQTFNYNIDCSDVTKTDDIQITIKVGNTLTNIFIKKNNNQSIHQECQASLGPYPLPVNNVVYSNEGNSHNIDINMEKAQSSQGKVDVANEKPCVVANKSASSKKHTASADTATVNFEITESVEKELSNIMECSEAKISKKQESDNSVKPKNTQKLDASIMQEKPIVTVKYADLKEHDNEDLGDLDIFDSGSVKETNIQLLKNTKCAPSEILAPTFKSYKTKILKIPDKRNREASDDIEIEKPSKKPKVTNSASILCDKSQKGFESESENINYDAIMSQVFANIDADIIDSQKSKLAENIQNVSKEKEETEKDKSQVTNINDEINDQSSLPLDNGQKNNIIFDRYSENIFTLVDKENESVNMTVKKDKNSGTTQQKIDNLLTPGLFQNLTSTADSQIEVEDVEKQMCTPLQQDDDDDKSIVEETPQKNISFAKPKNKTEQQKSSTESQNITSSIIDVSDITSPSVKDTAIVDVIRKQSETPLTISTFVGQITHKSTPVAKKSLNFNNEATDIEDPEQTLCPTTESIAKTTQEKIFLAKAFEQTPKSPVRKPLALKQDNERNYCVAGSCLTGLELAKLKMLCRQHNWKYVEKFTKQLTHLVVGVDDENKSQRSVKYMCALASSKWIISFQWVEHCLKYKKIVNEDSFEVLDGAGEPGPKRSRIAKKKLFEGISFYCMPPFSVLDVDTLKSMIEAAGGRVVSDVRAVTVIDERPVLLLAEPENSQENKFIYIAMELRIVPVNYEWVLNCLGSYTLGSIFEPLLCPAALLPPETARWPSQLVSQDSDETL